MRGVKVSPNTRYELLRQVLHYPSLKSCGLHRSSSHQSRYEGAAATKSARQSDAGCGVVCVWLELGTRICPE
jgi:hypothetical protein